MGFDWHWMASWAERDEGDRDTRVLPDLRPPWVFYVVLCPLSSPPSSCNTKKHFSLLCPRPLPSSWMCEVSTSGLKPVMSISFNPPQQHSVYQNFQVFSALNEYFSVTVQVLQLFWGLFAYRCSVAKCSAAWLPNIRTFSGLFPACLSEESGVLWPPCVDVQPSSLGLP